MKKMHLEREDLRSTKRLRQDTSTLGHGQDAQISCPRQQTLSVSPSKSQYSLTRTQSSDYGSLPTDYSGRNFHPQDEQLRFHHDAPQYGEDGMIIATASPTSVGGDDSAIGAASAAMLVESTHISQPVFHATGADQRLQLGSSALNLSCHAGARVPRTRSSSPPSTSSPSQMQNNLNSHSTSTSPSGNLQGHQKDWFPSPAQIARGVHHYFAHVSNFFPSLHQPTFDSGRAADYLILSMLSLAYQYDEDPACGDAFNSGARLSARCFHRARVLLASNEGVTADWSSGLAMI
ncbi:hypothetical protein RBB50_010614 [Rhinocladiella similis]